MLVAAKCSDEGWFSFAKLVRLWTHSDVSHIELVFHDGMCYSAAWLPERRCRWSASWLYRLRRWLLPAGTRFEMFHPKENTRWRYWSVCASVEEESAVRRWCIHRLGRLYDVLGLFGFVVDWDVEEPTAWYCSEVCARAITAAKIFEFPRRLTPGQMVELMEQHPDMFVPCDKNGRKLKD